MNDITLKTKEAKKENAFNSEEILIYLIELLLLYIEELSSFSSECDNQFAYGEKIAYIECLEILQKWEQAEIYGLDFQIEERYPL